MKSLSTIFAIFFLFISVGCVGSFEQSDEYAFESESEELENTDSKSDEFSEPAVEEDEEDELALVPAEDPIDIEEDPIEEEEVPDPDVRPEPGSVVIFEIPAGTGDGPWNSFEQPVVAYVGQVLLVVNNDGETHQLHVSGGGPTNHGQPMGANGGAQEFELNQASPLQANTPFYDHIDGGSAGFWLEIRP